MMKRLSAVFLSACLALHCLAVSAQTFEYDVDFTYLFDNLECGKCNDFYCESSTLHAARLTPQVGVGFGQDAGFRHKVMAGIDVMKNMGEASRVSGTEGEGYDNKKLFREMVLYYNLEKDFNGGTFSALAGCFSKANSEGHYSEVFYSDYSRFYDNNMEGMLFKWRSSRLYAELGLDWMGMHGEWRRERFQIRTAGKWDISKRFCLGWDGVVYHFAGSDNTPGVVDNNMIEGYFRFNIAPDSGFQELYAQLGYIGGYQRDRNVDDTSFKTGGGEFVFSAKRWNVGIQNDLYYGGDLMRYYDRTYSSGPLPYKYGSDLYMGNTFYHFVSGQGLYDRLEIYYQPKITDFISLRLSVRLHFVSQKNAPSGLVGNQEAAALLFNLDAVRRHAGKKEGKPRHFGEYFVM